MRRIGTFGLAAALAALVTAVPAAAAPRKTANVAGAGTAVLLERLFAPILGLVQSANPSDETAPAEGAADNGQDAGPQIDPDG